MQQYIDIDEEKARLWRLVYSDLRDTLIANYGLENAFANPDLPNNIISVYVDIEGNVMAKNENSEEVLMEDYDDDVLFEIYRLIVVGKGVS